MDERPNKTTLEAKDFKPGDLVAIAAHHILIEEVDFRSEATQYAYGVVVALEEGNTALELFPQVAVYVFRNSTVEYHWPSYLRVVSSRR